MKRITLSLLLSVMAVAFLHAENKLVLYNCNIVDTENGKVIPGKTIHVENGKIVKIENAKKKLKKGQTDATGKFVMPGLIDSHMHWGSFAPDSASAEYMSKIYLKEGVTTVRDLGGNVKNIHNYLDWVKDGIMDGPRIYYCSFWATGDYHIQSNDIKGSEHKDWAPWSRMFSVKDSTDTAIEKAVLEAKETGCMGFKIYVNYTPEELARMIPIMKKHGMKVWAHSSQYNGAKAIDVANSGVEVMSHAYMLCDDFQEVKELSDEKKKYLGEVCEAIKKNNVVLDPTVVISAYNDMEFAIEIMKQAYAAGVKFVVGTDYVLNNTMENTGFSKEEGFRCAVQEEMKVLHEKCGISIPEILKAATTNGAEILDMQGRLGCVSEGAEADLLVLETNPLQSLEALKHIDTLILRGKVVDKQD